MQKEGPAALLGRHITVAAMNIGESLELVRQGQARPLAQAAPERSALAPDIPTFKEQGFDLADGVVRGLAVPAGTPAPIRARLEAALLATMDDTAWQADAARLFQPLRRMDGAAFTQLVRQEAETLRRFAALIKSQLRAADALARWGGEEFLLLMPGTRADHARVVLDRLRDAVAGGGFEAIAPQLKVSFSAGVAEVLEGETQDAAIDRADRALYRAKQAGRNRVEVAAEAAA